MNSARLPPMQARRSSPEERGLKSNYCDLDMDGSRRSSPEERGLKSLPDCAEVSVFGSLLTRGAWIEITQFA